jgi:DNA repair protein RadC
MQPLFRIQPAFDLPRLKLLPWREQPAYRVAANSDSCNLPELLAALIGGPQQIEIAEAVLARFTNITRLQQAHVSEIAEVKGIGRPTKCVGKQTAVRLKAALALARKALQETDEERPIIHNPADAAALVQYEMSLLEQEHLRELLLDTRNRVIDIVEIYHGSLNTSQVRVAELFKPAIQRNAAAIIVLHNHPSGSVEPSPEDISVTRAILQAGQLLDITLLDHLILGHPAGKFTSLKERGLAFSS